MPAPDKDRWETDEDVGPVGAGVPHAAPGPSRHRARSKTLPGFPATSPHPSSQPPDSSPPVGTVSGVQMIARDSHPMTLEPTARFTRDELEKVREQAMKSISPSPPPPPTPTPVSLESSSTSRMIVHQHPPFFRRLWYAFARWCLVYIFGEKPRS